MKWGWIINETEWNEPKKAKTTTTEWVNEVEVGIGLISLND